MKMVIILYKIKNVKNIVVIKSISYECFSCKMHEKHLFSKWTNYFEKNISLQ